MTIDEAIRILQRDIDEHYCLEGKSVDAAHKLGIEALKLFKEFQKVTGGHQGARLPGETNE